MEGSEGLLDKWAQTTQASLSRGEKFSRLVREAVAGWRAKHLSIASLFHQAIALLQWESHTALNLHLHALLEYYFAPALGGSVGAEEAAADNDEGGGGGGGAGGAGGGRDEEDF